LPEALIAGRERIYLNWFLRRKAANPETFSDAELNEYFRIFIKDGGLRAGLAYYCAAALSAQQNRALSAKGKLKMPVLTLTGDQGWSMDMTSPLKAFVEDVRSSIVAHCGHFIPEEQQQAVADAMIAFFSEA
jgi:pimeloyl-ACP methyl ester carboxylesterase